jgi:organic hydroperoxide reductase OsmC/OhrA
MEAERPLIDRELLRETVVVTTEKLRGNPQGGIIRPYVETRLIHNVSAEASWEQSGREFSVRSDEAPGRGGNGEHPTAIRYFLSGISFCLAVWYAKAAALADVELGSFELRLEAAIDMRVEYGLPPAPGPEFFLATARVSSPASAAEIRSIAEEAHRRCPLANLVARSVPVYVRVIHDGAVVVDTAPAPSES